MNRLLYITVLTRTKKKINARYPCRPTIWTSFWCARAASVCCRRTPSVRRSPGFSVSVGGDEKDPAAIRDFRFFFSKYCGRKYCHKLFKSILLLFTWRRSHTIKQQQQYYYYCYSAFSLIATVITKTRADNVARGGSLRLRLRPRFTIIIIFLKKYA